MSEYATIAEIESKFLDIEFSSETTITKSDIKKWIVRKSNLIDARIASRYILPIQDNATTEQALSILKEICIDLVIFEIEDVLNLGRTQPKSEDGKPEKTRGQRAKESAISELKSLEKGITTLIGVQVKTADIYNSNNDSASYDPVFKKNERQW